MLRHLRLIALFARVSLLNDTAYRFDFLMRVFVALLQLGGELLTLWVIFTNTRSVAGWNVYQVLVLLGVFRMMTGTIGMVIAPNMRAIMDDIRSGTLDFVLTKPINPQFLVSVRRWILWRATDVLIGAALATIGAASQGALSWERVALFLLMLAAGALIIYSFWLALATSVFWFTRINNVEMIFWNVFEAGRYPIDIYRPWVRWLLTYLIPLAFLITFPAGALTGKGGWTALLAAAIVAPLALLSASLFWRYGLRSYRGASA